MKKKKKATKKNRSSKKWCRECGFHIRSKDHATGAHHVSKAKKDQGVYEGDSK